MNLTTAQYCEIFKHKFELVNEHLRELRSKALERRGSVFTRYLYTVDELLSSRHFAKIEAITGKIASDVSEWRKSGQLSDHGAVLYEIFRLQTQEKVEDLREAVRLRAPTAFESTQKVAAKIVQAILAAVPVLKAVAGLLPNGSEQKRLPPAA
jgi:hypothetical protein